MAPAHILAVKGPTCVSGCPLPKPAPGWGALHQKAPLGQPGEGPALHREGPHKVRGSAVPPGPLGDAQELCGRRGVRGVRAEMGRGTRTPIPPRLARGHPRMTLSISRQSSSGRLGSLWW